MNSTDNKTLWVALAAGVASAFLIYSYTQEKKAEMDRANGALKTVLVAATDIREMNTILDTYVEEKQVPSQFIEKDALTDRDAALGQVAGMPIKKGQQITNNMLLQPGSDTGIALRVSPSKRALALPIDEVRGVAKLIRPGDHVDIYAAVDSGKGLNQKREVVRLMEDVIILATGTNVKDNLPRMLELDNNNSRVYYYNLRRDSTYSTITIEASPREAQDLIYLLTSSPGSIFFTLRNPDDKKEQMRVPASSADSLLGKFGMGDSGTAGAPGGVPNGGISPIIAPPQRAGPAPNR